MKPVFIQSVERTQLSKSANAMLEAAACSRPPERPGNLTRPSTLPGKTIGVFSEVRFRHRCQPDMDEARLPLPGIVEAPRWSRQFWGKTPTAKGSLSFPLGSKNQGHERCRVDTRERELVWDKREDLIPDAVSKLRLRHATFSPDRGRTGELEAKKAKKCG